MNKETEGQKLINFWYTVLNNTDGYTEVLQRLESYLADDKVELKSLIEKSERSGSNMLRSMCYDALQKAGRELTAEQQEFLGSHRWQDDFWPRRK